MKATIKKAPDTSATLAVTRRQVLHASVMKKMVPELRARAFAVAWLEDLRRVERVRDAVASVTQGKSWQAATSEVAKELEHILGKEAAKTAARKVVVSETQKAVSVARYREMTDPEEMALFPYWQYKSVGDGRVRDAHSALHGLTLPADDPFWREHFPPWDYGCRCKVVQVSKAKADRMRAQHDTHLVEDELARETLRAGHIQAGHGTVDIRSPAQKALTEEERHAAYRHQPGDLHLSLDSVRARYLDNPDKRAFFMTFATAAKDKIIDKATGRTAWDWLCEADLRVDAQQCLAHAQETGEEMAIVRRYDTGEWYTTAFGKVGSVTPEMPDAPHTSIHCHPSGIATPSPPDLLVFSRPEVVNSSIVAKGDTHIYRYTVPKMPAAQEAINDFVIEWQPKVQNGLSEEMMQRYSEALDLLIKLGHIKREVLNG